MKTTATICLALFPFILTGCLSMRRDKALVITPEPGVTQVTVAAQAKAKCLNLILITVCSLDLDMRQVGGRSPQSPQAKKVREFIVANYEGIIAELGEGRGQLLAALLELLRVPPGQQAEAVLKLKEINLRTKKNPQAFFALVIDSLLNPA